MSKHDGHSLRWESGRGFQSLWYCRDCMEYVRGGYKDTSDGRRFVETVRGTWP